MKNIFTILTATALLFTAQNAEAATTADDNNTETRIESVEHDSDTDRVEAGKITYYTYHARALKPARVVVIGDGDTDLDVYIFDSDANVIAEDSDELDVCVCEWIPKHSGDYIIAIKNWGNVYNEFTITVE